MPPSTPRLDRCPSQGTSPSHYAAAFAALTFRRRPARRLLALAAAGCATLFPSALDAASDVSTGNPTIDAVIDKAAKDKAATLAAAGTSADKLKAADLKPFFAELGVDEGSKAAKRLLEKIKEALPSQLDGQLGAAGIRATGSLAALVRQEAAKAHTAAVKKQGDALAKAEQALAAARQLLVDAKAKNQAATDTLATDTTDDTRQKAEQAATDAVDKLKQALADTTAKVAGTPADTDHAGGAKGETALKTGTPDANVASAAKIQIADSLKLLTAHLFQGRAYLWGRPWNLEITSSVPASSVDPTTSTTYSDTQLQLPDGGPLNIRIGLLSNLFNLKARQVYFESDSGVPIYGDRGDEYDRYYFFGNHDLSVGSGESQVTKKEISVGDALIYLRDGIDLKMIYRAKIAAGANATTPGTASNKPGDYGLAAGYYVAVGFDGGLFDHNKNLADTSTGNYRLEALFMTQITDKRSLSLLYPNATNPSNKSMAVGGRAVFVLTNHINLDVQAMWPVGGSHGYMGQTLLGGFTFTR